jgi:hypothetical protein
MCYSDVAGSASSVSLANKLTLRVEDRLRVARYGNTSPDAPRVPDTKNNVQRVIWDDVSPGDYRAIVECTQITRTTTNTSQDFYLAWYANP